MTIAIVTLMILGYLLICTEHITHINKATVAVFCGVWGWVLYVCVGPYYVETLHDAGFQEFLGNEDFSIKAVNEYIRQNVFAGHVAQLTNIVMYLLTTMAIVDVLSNNGCFDFVPKLCRQRSTWATVWMLALCSFLLSANLDNLTTAVVMLTMLNRLVVNHRQRMLLGTIIVIATNCGGCFTVIGDCTGLVLWGDETITATRFSAYLALPALVAWIVPTVLINRQLPSHIDIEWTVAPYRGDDTRLNRWQRLLMLFVAIGGLWFVPTFLSLTRLSPFLGALCVLSVLWVVNEAFNRKLMNADQMSQRRFPRVLQYGAIQQMLFVMGIMLGFGAVAETGVLTTIATWVEGTVGNVWIIGIISGFLSSAIDQFTIALSDIYIAQSLHDVATTAGDYGQNGAYWLVTAFSTAVGGCLLCVGSTCGIALMQMEHIHLGWYVRNLTPKVLVGWLAGLLVLYLETLL
ncbi:MAG: sodium:proton antiporter [Prevotella sp.]|nr:sodium:proton antiporter [Prevotella sp.]